MSFIRWLTRSSRKKRTSLARENSSIIFIMQRSNSLYSIESDATDRSILSFTPSRYTLPTLEQTIDEESIDAQFHRSPMASNHARASTDHPHHHHHHHSHVNTRLDNQSTGNHHSSVDHTMMQVRFIIRMIFTTVALIM
jgi:hypothetical protein